MKLASIPKIFTLCEPFWEWDAAIVDHVVLELESLIGSMMGCLRARDTYGNRVIVVYCVLMYREKYNYKMNLYELHTLTSNE